MFRHDISKHFRIGFSSTQLSGQVQSALHDLLCPRYDTSQSCPLISTAFLSGAFLLKPTRVIQYEITIVTGNSRVYNLYCYTTAKNLTY